MCKCKSADQAGGTVAGVSIEQPSLEQGCSLGSSESSFSLDMQQSGTRKADVRILNPKGSNGS